MVFVYPRLLRLPQKQVQSSDSHLSDSVVSPDQPAIPDQEDSLATPNLLPHPKQTELLTHRKLQQTYHLERRTFL